MSYYLIVSIILLLILILILIYIFKNRLILCTESKKLSFINKIASDIITRKGGFESSGGVKSRNRSNSFKQEIFIEDVGFNGEKRRNSENSPEPGEQIYDFDQPLTSRSNSSNSSNKTSIEPLKQSLDKPDKSIESDNFSLFKKRNNNSVISGRFIEEVKYLTKDADSWKDYDKLEKDNIEDFSFIVGHVDEVLKLLSEKFKTILKNQKIEIPGKYENMPFSGIIYLLENKISKRSKHSGDDVLDNKKLIEFAKTISENPKSIENVSDALKVISEQISSNVFYLNLMTINNTILDFYNNKISHVEFDNKINTILSSISERKSHVKNDKNIETVKAVVENIKNNKLSIDKVMRQYADLIQKSNKRNVKSELIASDIGQYENILYNEFLDAVKEYFGASIHQSLITFIDRNNYNINDMYEIIRGLSDTILNTMELYNNTSNYTITKDDAGFIKLFREILKHASGFKGDFDKIIRESGEIEKKYKVLLEVEQKLNERIKSLEDRINICNSDKEVLRERILEFEGTAEGCDSELEKSKGRISELTKEVKRLTTQLKEKKVIVDDINELISSHEKEKKALEAVILKNITDCELAKKAIIKEHEKYINPEIASLQLEDLKKKYVNYVDPETYKNGLEKIGLLFEKLGIPRDSLDNKNLSFNDIASSLTFEIEDKINKISAISKKSATDNEAREEFISECESIKEKYQTLLKSDFKTKYETSEKNKSDLIIKIKKTEDDIFNIVKFIYENKIDRTLLKNIIESYNPALNTPEDLLTELYKIKIISIEENDENGNSEGETNETINDINDGNNDIDEEDNSEKMVNSTTGSILLSETIQDDDEMTKIVKNNKKNFLDIIKKNGTDTKDVLKLIKQRKFIENVDEDTFILLNRLSVKLKHDKAFSDNLKAFLENDESKIIDDLKLRVSQLTDELRILKESNEMLKNDPSIYTPSKDIVKEMKRLHVQYNLLQEAKYRALNTNFKTCQNEKLEYSTKLRQLENERNMAEEERSAILLQFQEIKKLYEALVFENNASTSSLELKIKECESLSEIVEKLKSEKLQLSTQTSDLKEKVEILDVDNKQKNKHIEKIEHVFKKLEEDSKPIIKSLKTSADKFVEESRHLKDIATDNLKKVPNAAKQNLGKLLKNGNKLTSSVISASKPVSGFVIKKATDLYSKLNKAWEAQYKKLSQEILLLRNKYEKYDVAETEYKKEIDTFKSYLKQVIFYSTDTKKQNDILVKKLLIKDAEIYRLKDILKSTENIIENEDPESNKCKKNIDALKEKIIKYEDDFKIIIPIMRKEKLNLNKTIQNLRDALINERKKYDLLLSASEKLKEDITAYQADNLKLRNIIKQLEADKNAIKKDKIELQKIIDDQNEKLVLNKSTIESLEQKNKLCNESLLKCRSENDALKTHIKELEDSINSAVYSQNQPTPVISLQNQQVQPNIQSFQPASVPIQNIDLKNKLLQDLISKKKLNFT